MVRRALVCEVERYFDSQFPGSRQQSLEIFERAQTSVDGFVPAFARPDGPGAANVLGSSGFSVVLSLAISPANGVNGRQVENIKSHPGHVIQSLGAVLQSSLPAGLAGD